MLYTHLDIWTKNGQIWHALYTPGTRELSLSRLSEASLKKTIAWAASHQMTIIDKRDDPAYDRFTQKFLKLTPLVRGRRCRLNQGVENGT